MDHVLAILTLLYGVGVFAGSIACLIMGLSDLDRTRHLGRVSKTVWALLIITMPVTGALLFYLIVKPEYPGTLENS